MLILSRRLNDTLELYKDGKILATIMVTGLLNDRVRLGIDAGEDVQILRGEIPNKRIKGAEHATNTSQV